VCGIAGVLDRRTPGEEALRRVASDMADTLVHRGPDDSGVMVDVRAGLALANRRLAVVGLGPGGHQPMSSSSGRWAITFNGEVYNFGSVRRRLGAEGVALRGGSDTEVLLEAIEHWGLDEALESSEGMFAFAAWDSERRELHLVRDRLGEKPLFFGWVGSCFAFGSELKSLRRVPGFGASLDLSSVGLFLRHNCVPAPYSVYEGISKLEPAEIRTLSPATPVGGEPSSRRYWSARGLVDRAGTSRLDGSPRELVDHLHGVLSEAVAARMVSEVPLGAFLSGGVDSSLVVALMQEQSGSTVKTFTAGFAERAYDESSDAEAVAACLGTDHTTLTVTESEALEVVPEIPVIWDEPFSDSSQIPTFLVSRLARRDVTVALSGDGGDELFAGYNRHLWLERIWRRWGRAPHSVRRSIGRLAQALPPGLDGAAARFGPALPRSWRLRLPALKLAKAGKVIAAPDVESAYLALVSHWDDPSELIGPVRDAPTLASSPAKWPVLDSPTEQLLWLDLVGYLPDDILTKLDRAAMAVSLETRVPFLAREVVELAWRLPTDVKLRGSVTKWILRELLHRYVPESLVARPKAGFGVPLGRWLRGPLRGWAEDLLSARRLGSAGILDPVPIRRAWDLHRSGRRDLGYELWDVLCLQAWLERWAGA
jgi:asparagine synthase (glutamine-hydrolysing)